MIKITLRMGEKSLKIVGIEIGWSKENFSRHKLKRFFSDRKLFRVHKELQEIKAFKEKP